MLKPRGLDNLRFNDDGFIPCIIQDAETKTVLDNQFMNRKALELTFEIGETHFWSKSRCDIYRKGFASGNIQKIIDVFVKCDEESLLVLVDQQGDVCHKGKESCFHWSLLNGE